MNRGTGIQSDSAEAAKWCRKAAEQGDVEAQYDLGLYYYSGRGVKEDLVEAVKWYRMAAEQGHAEAQYKIGWCYSHSHIWHKDVKKDLVEAIIEVCITD